MSNERLSEIYTQLYALETEAEAIHTENNRIFIEKITGLKVPEDVKSIELSYTYTVGVPVKGLRTRIDLSFNGSTVHSDCGGRNSEDKYPEFTKRMAELMESPDTITKALDEFFNSKPQRKARKSDMSWMMFR